MKLKDLVKPIPLKDLNAMRDRAEREQTSIMLILIAGFMIAVVFKLALFVSDILSNASL